MYLYDRINPNWKADYYEVEKTKPVAIQTRLNGNNIQDIIDGASGDEVLEMCLTMHIANRIAHEYEYNRNVIIRNFLEKKFRKSRGKNYTEGDFETQYDSKRLNDITKKVTDYLDVGPSDETKERIKKRLEKEGITEKDLEELDKLGVGALIRARKEAFAAKDYEIYNTVRELKKPEYKDVSYGVIAQTFKDSTTGTLKRDKDKKDNILVVDVPYYGQFNVHLKSMGSISSLRPPKYPERLLFETKTVLLSDEVSLAGKRFFNKKKSRSFDGLKGDLKHLARHNPRYAHYLALKVGATKKELREMHRRSGGEER